MAICKDCFHYCVCDLIVHKMPDIDFYADKVEVLCGNFKNKSDLKEVKHGYWNLIDNCSNEGVYCSVCSKKVYTVYYANQKIKSKYCPNCGARMDGDDNG